MKRVTFNQQFGTKATNDSEYSDSPQNLQISNQHSKEPEITNWSNSQV